MNRNKLSLLISGVAALVVLAGGWFLGVQPQLGAASANAAQKTSIDTANTTNRAELVRLQQQFTTLDAMKSDLAELSASVPSTADTETFIKQLTATATSTGASISSISVGDAAPYTSPAAPATTPTDGSTASASASASPSASPSDSASATPSAAPTGPATVTNPSITSANFTVIPITVAISGSSDQALAFTKGAQTGKRLFLIDSLSSSSGSSDGASSDAVTAGTGTQSWTLSGYIYVLDTAVSAATPTTTNG